MKLNLCFFDIPTAPSAEADQCVFSPPPPPKLLLSDTSVSSNSSNNNSSSTTPTSLHSELSLQSHPSLPSLQLQTYYYSSLLETSPCSPASSSSSSSVVVSNLPFPISSLALSAPFLYAASGPTLYVFSSSSLSLLHSFPSNSSSSAAPIKSISFSRLSSRQDNTTNRLLVLTAHQDGRIRVWLQPNHLDSSSSSHRLLAVLPTAADRLRRCAVPSNYVSVRRHKKRLWLHHNDAVSALATTNTTTSINDGGGLVYSVSWDKSLKVWRASDFKCLESIPAHEDAVNAVAVSPSDGVVYTGSADGRIRVWGNTNRPDVGEKSSSTTNNSKKIKHCLIATLEKHRSAVNALALMTDQRSNRTVLFSGACDRSIVVWERRRDGTASSSSAGSYNMVATGALRGHEKAILCLAAVGDVLVSGSADRTVRMWRRSLGAEEDTKFCCLAVLEGHQKPVKSVQAKKVDEMEGDDGQRDGTDATSYSVFSGSLDGEIRAWQVKVTSSSTALAGGSRRGAGDGNNEDVSFLCGAGGGRRTADTSVYPSVELW